jgi:hypothetical protein
MSKKKMSQHEQKKVTEGRKKEGRKKGRKEGRKEGR